MPQRFRMIAAEPQAIWDVLADFGAVSSWAGSVDHSCMLSPAADGVGVGSARRVQFGRDVIVERITEFAAPRTLAYDVEGLPRRLGRVSSRWTLIPAASGCTVVTLTNTVEIGSGPLQELAERAVGRTIARRFDAILDSLAQRLEACG